MDSRKGEKIEVSQILFFSEYIKDIEEMVTEGIFIKQPEGSEYIEWTDLKGNPQVFTHINSVKFLD